MAHLPQLRPKLRTSNRNREFSLCSLNVRPASYSLLYLLRPGIAQVSPSRDLEERSDSLISAQPHFTHSPLEAMCARQGLVLLEPDGAVSAIVVGGSNSEWPKDAVSAYQVATLPRFVAAAT